VRTPVRLAVVATGLGAVFAAAVGVGAAVGPVGAPGAHPPAAAPTPRQEPAATGTGYVLDVLDVLEEQPAAGTTTVAFRRVAGSYDPQPLPEPAPAPGPHVPFAVAAPSTGTHPLFLDFRHGDAVHTTAFTVQVTGTAADAPAEHGHGG
jgi:hypothetical protein